MDRMLINYLPSVIAEVREYKAVLIDGEQPEFVRIWDCVDNAFNDQYILDATDNGVSRWEKLLGLKPKATETLDDRKLKILSRLYETLPYTIRILIQMLNAICGADGYSLEIFNDIYTLKIILERSQESNYDSILEILNRIIPANIVLDLSLRCNSHAFLSRFTHRELAEYTQTQLRNKLLEE